MIVISAIIFAILLVIFFVAICITVGDAEFFPLVIISAALLVPGCISYSNHIDNTVELEVNAARVAVVQEKINRLYSQYNTISALPLTKVHVLANGDTPVAALVQAIGSTESELANTKMKRVRAEISIKKRERSVFSIITKF